MCCGLTTAVCFLGLFLLYKFLDRLIRRPKVGRYAERYVFVTGCDSGFGRTSAIRLDRLGCHVFAGCLTEKGEVDLRKTGSDRLQTVSLDVTKSESVRRAYEFVKNTLPPGKGLWGLVNNAGVGGKRGRLEWVNIDDYKFVNSVNLYGLVDMTTTFLPLIKKARGRIVNTVSLAGRVSIPDGVPYTVSKYGAEAFSDALRRSIAMYGCKVSIIEPGGFQTMINTQDAIKNGVMSAWNGASAEIREEFGEEFLQNTIQSLQNVKIDTNLDEVVIAYEDALFCRFPRARYVVGSQGRLGALIPPLPEWLADWVLERLRKGSDVKPAILKKGRR